jgi:hypothetical protein
MLASFPASILNQIPAESGIPFDSIKKQTALAHKRKPAAAEADRRSCEASRNRKRDGEQISC